MQAILLGVDGGGTRTRARLADANGSVLGTGEAGSSNMQAQGAEAAQREILSAISHAFADAGLPPSPIHAACLGLAGAARPDERDLMTRWAMQTICKYITLVSDVELVLAAGTPALWGVALIAGTGSIAWGKTQDGRTAARVAGAMCWAMKAAPTTIPPSLARRNPSRRWPRCANPTPRRHLAALATAQPAGADCKGLSSANQPGGSGATGPTGGGAGWARG
ncbi:MAG: hypothetical protein HC853_05015 [Anaerolineae bacterium]|nr:hypothetical protein [Anaerolineae bacterium]